MDDAGTDGQTIRAGSHCPECTARAGTRDFPPPLQLRRAMFWASERLWIVEDPTAFDSAVAHPKGVIFFVSPAMLEGRAQLLWSDLRREGVPYAKMQDIYSPGLIDWNKRRP